MEINDWNLRTIKCRSFYFTSFCQLLHPIRTQFTYFQRRSIDIICLRDAVLFYTG